MFSKADKVSSSHISRNDQKGGTAFFRKAGEETLSVQQQSNQFFSPAIQPKLTVSSPDDPQEKEADRMADKVMRMTEQVSAQPGQEKEEKLQKKESPDNKEEETIQKQEEELQTKPESLVLQRKCAGCEQEEKQVQRKEADKENEEIHAKHFGIPVIQRAVFASEEAAVEEPVAKENRAIQRKKYALHHSDIIQMSGRGPPAGIMHFENNLSSSKGRGAPMPRSTQQFMESRFGADFGGVRIHTGSYAENLSSSIQAQAFTHGNDIYFNTGKYAPNTEAGGTLLAHELTHTIQQGASKTLSPPQTVSPSLQRKNIVQRVPAGPVPQLTSAVEKAKSKEGKVNAGKEGPDGYREGWQDLVDFFKTTFGADKIIGGASGTTVTGAVAEQDIKKKRTTTGMIVNKADVNGNRISGERDAMPSWCGIFVFWALNKSGVPMPKWVLGQQVVKPEAAYPPGHTPQTGDIAYKDGYSHYAIVESATGDSVKTVNGNTAGEDNMGGQIQTREHPLSNWTAFFNPLLNMEGSLGSGEKPAEKPKTLRELRRELFHVNRKTKEEHPEIQDNTNTETHAKPELSSWHVNSDGNMHTADHQIPVKANDEKIQLKENEHEEEDKSRTSKENMLQKKTAGGLNMSHPYCSQEKNNIFNSDNIQSKYQSPSDSSLTYNAGTTAVKVNAMHERGPPVHLSRSEQKIQCGWFDDAIGFVNSAIDYAAEGLEAGKRLLLAEARDFVMAIPGYRALRVVLGEDPITSELVERNGHNFIEAAFDIMPGGRLLHQKLEELGALAEAEAFVDRRIVEVESLVHNVINRIEIFWNGLTLSSLASPMKIFEDAGNIIHSTIAAIISFAEHAAAELLSIVKRWLLSQIVDFIRTRTTAYPLLCVILGQDPVTEQPVTRNGTNILNALLELGGEEGRQQRTQMQDTGTFQKAVGYIDEGIAVFGNLYDTIRTNFGLIWNMVSIETLMHPIDTFTRLYETFAEPVLKVWDFVKRVAAEILKFIKQVLMQRLSAWARQQRGYTLLTVIIRRDPFTNEPVPFTMHNVIRGFFSLMDGGEEQYNQLKESGAIDRTVGKITAAVARLNMTPAAIIQLFVDLWNSFSLNDLAHPIEAFKRIIARFGQPIAKLIAFVIEIIKIVIEAILIVMNFPFDLINNIIAKAMQAYELIKKDPVKFLKNLLRAIKEGFMQFFDNVLTHLWNGLKAWFLGEVEAAGIPIPTDFSVMGMIKWLLVVLDITMEKIWKKLEDRIGKEKVDKIKRFISGVQRVASAAGEAYQFVKDVQEKGFVTVITEKIKEKLSNVWDMVLDAVKNFVMEQIVNKVTAKLLSMLDPTGIMAVINSAIALYKAIQSFIKYLRKMLEIVNSFVEGTLQIAQGATKKAADFLEGALARGVPIVIGFLANQVGLNLSERLKDALEWVREKVDKGLTWVIDKLVTIVEKLVSVGKAAVASVKDTFASLLGFKRTIRSGNATHTIYYHGTEEAPEMMVASTPKPLLQALSDRKDEIDAAAAGTPDAVNKRVWKQKINQAKERYNTDLITAYRIKRLVKDEKQQLQLTLQIYDATDFIQGVLEEVKITNADFGRGQLKAPVAVNDTIKSKERSERGNKVTPRFRVLRIINESSQVEIQQIDHLTGMLTGALRTVPFDNISGSLKQTEYAIDPAGASIEIDAYNNTDTWPDRNIGRKILNYRYHEVQTNPAEHDWEHIIEHTTGGANSVDNLALTSSENNSDLAAAYNTLLQVPGSTTNAPRSVLEFFSINTASATFKAFVTYVHTKNSQEGKVRDFLRSESDASVQRTWKEAAYSKMRISVSNRMNRGRGEFRVLN